MDFFSKFIIILNHKPFLTAMNKCCLSHPGVLWIYFPTTVLFCMTPSIYLQCHCQCKCGNQGHPALESLSFLKVVGSQNCFSALILKLQDSFLCCRDVRVFWGVNLVTVNTFDFLADMVATVREILRRGMSVNLYMFHGGSSFGFMSGALDEPSYKALVPSHGWFLCVMCPITNKPGLFLI